MAVSHANCTHPRTPAGRRACRKSTGLDIKGPIDHVSGEKVVTGPRLPQKPVRIQPRRSGARVPPRGSVCVQAALHTDDHGGRCACGWVADRSWHA